MALSTALKNALKYSLGAKPTLWTELTSAIDASTSGVATNAAAILVLQTNAVQSGTATAVQNAILIGPYGVGAGNTGEIRFKELAAGGANYVGFKAPDAIGGNKIWVLPAADGAAGEILTTDGAGNLSFAAAVVAGTGGTLTGNLIMDNEKAIRFREASGGGTNYIGLKAAAALAGDVTFTLPIADGSANQVLATDASANLSWISVVRPAVASTVQAALVVGPHGIAAGNTGELRFLELAAGGTNYVGFKAADAIAANVIWTLPSADGSANQALVTDASGILSWLSFVRPAVASTVQAALVVGPFGVAAGNTGELRFLELAAGGVNYVGFKAADTIAANLIWTLPSADGSANQVMVTSGAGVLSFASVGVANCDSDLVAEATGTLTATQVRKLNATPIDLIASPGAGKAIIVEDIELFMDWNANVYDAVGAGDDLQLEYAGGVDIMRIESAGFVDQVNDEKWYGKANAYDVAAGVAGGIDLLTIDNEAVRITVLVGELAAADADVNGDSPIKWKIRYRVKTLLT